MIISPVAKRYAKSLISLSEQIAETNVVLEDLQKTCTVIFETPELKQFFLNPLIKADVKIQSIQQELIQKKSLSLSFISLLIEKNRLKLLLEITQAFQLLIDHKNGVTRGQLISDQPINENIQKTIEKSLSQKLNKKIILTTQVNKQLLGGVVAQAGGWTFDDSLLAHLNKLEEVLK